MVQRRIPRGAVVVQFPLQRVDKAGHLGLGRRVTNAQMQRLVRQGHGGGVIEKYSGPKYLRGYLKPMH